MPLDIEAPRPPQTVVERLSPVATKLLSLRARLGAVPYRVFVRTYAWSGGERHRGTRELRDEVEVIPPPDLKGGTSTTVGTQGVAEHAQGLRFERIAPTLAEGLMDLLRAPATASEEILIELEHDGRTGARGKDIYRPAGSLTLDPLRFFYTLPLELLDDRAEVSP